MELERHQDLLKAQVESIIQGLLRTLEDSIKSRLPNGVLPKDVADWWTMHYRSKFYYAMDYKGVKHDDKAKDALREAAIKLGAALLEKAGNKSITRDHAAEASYATDCPPDEDSHILQKWCN